MRATGAARDGGMADGKVIIERLCISLPYVESFNSKVIKRFIPELKSRYVFFVFRDSNVLCICYEHSMYISHISIWLWYKCHHHHHHHVVPQSRISLALSRHFSLSFIAFGRSSGLHPVSSHSCCMYVRAGRPAFAWPYAGVHRSTSLMSSFLLFQQCPACLVRLTCIVFVMGGKWPLVLVLWGVAARTCSILLSTFLCSCRLASSSAV